MWRFTDSNVRCEFITAWRFAVTPINRSPPSLAKATTEGVVLAPSAMAITTASPFSMVATRTLFVVPKSIPITFTHFFHLLGSKYWNSTIIFIIIIVAKI